MTKILGYIWPETLVGIGVLFSSRHGPLDYVTGYHIVAIITTMVAGQVHQHTVAQLLEKSMNLANDIIEGTALLDLLASTSINAPTATNLGIQS